MSVELNAIVYRDLHGALERPGKRERDSISPVPLYGEEENENKRQKKGEEGKEDEEDQSCGHSSSEDMSEEEGEAPGDRENPASNDRTDALEAKLEKIMLDHERFKLYCETLKLDHEKLKLNNEILKLNDEMHKLNYETLKIDYETLKTDHEMLKFNYESCKEQNKVRFQGLEGRVSQGTRATNWEFGRLRATTKTAYTAATVVMSLWGGLRKKEAIPRPTRSPAVVSVASFADPGANPGYWSE
ncbi:unnamed protein product [Clonostachys rosea f. rosea IK726]|jgi:hypothetical protein|uniref:Uncharacterized protein n=1 Tax=Clonostachys rosea f. rosea IK726 TaxID=1349383 RepID=A0ACA9TLP2_BIOOC|nr:unnamed protein product [Clonostachys rosea f. rosea IK726]